MWRFNHPLFLAFAFNVFVKQSQGQLCPLVGERGNTTQCYNVKQLLTSSSGAPVDNNIAIMTAGRRGPVILNDLVYMDQMPHLNRERIPERIGHAKGAGAFGYLEITDVSFKQFCKASLFDYVGKKTNLFARFSTSTGNAGSCDTIRNVRGLGIKFYSDDGNWDLLCISTPTFTIRDPILLPSAVRASKRDPVTNNQNATMFWDFMTLREETAHQLLMLFSDRGIPDGFRQSHFYGANTFKVVNRQGTPYYCKFVFRTNVGIKNLNATEAARLCGADPDHAVRDLFTNIAEGNYPSWTLYYQVMTFEQADASCWNPFDVTKVWPRAEYPLHEIGKLVMDKNPRNYFAEVEQSAFSPANLVPGIEPSPDKLLQGRMFAYSDAQRYRLGANHMQLPVNMPRVPVNNNQRDGAAAYLNQDGNIVYYPNSFGQHSCPAATQSEYPVCGDVKRYDTGDEDNFSQPEVFWGKVLNETQRTTMIEVLAAHVKTTPQPLQERVVALFRKVAEDMGDRLASALALSS